MVLLWVSGLAVMACPVVNEGAGRARVSPEQPGYGQRQVGYPVQAATVAARRRAPAVELPGQVRYRHRQSATWQSFRFSLPAISRQSFKATAAVRQDGVILALPWMYYYAFDR